MLEFYSLFMLIICIHAAELNQLMRMNCVNQRMFVRTDRYQMKFKCFLYQITNKMLSKL